MWTFLIYAFVASVGANIAVLYALIGSMNRIIKLSKETRKQDMVIEGLQSAIDKVFTRELKQMVADGKLKKVQQLGRE